MENEERIRIEGKDGLHNDVGHWVLPREKVNEIVDNLNWDDVVEQAWNAHVFGSITGIAYLNLETGEVHTKQYIGNSEDIDDLADLELLRYGENMHGSDLFLDGTIHDEDEILEMLMEDVRTQMYMVQDEIEQRLNEIYEYVVT